MKIGIVLGTRPEIIKMAPVIRELEKQKIDFFLIHSNQHYTKEMDEIIFKDLSLNKPHYNLEVGSGIHGLQTGKMLAGIEEVLIKEKPDVLIVHGDTNTTLSGALAASKLGIKIAHVEAGLRSHDKSMPEEINRVLTDHITDFCFAPTQKAKDNLIKEGMDPNKIFITGNTVVDALNQHLSIAENKSDILQRHGITKKNYALVTAHRPANVDDKEKLQELMDTLGIISEKHDLQIIYPVHPRSEKMIKEHSIKISPNIKTIPPVGYLDFLNLQKNASIILTDSGGIQEEACILGVPCITLRENTERPETLDVGANMLTGIKKERVLEGVNIMLNKKESWQNPFGEGNAAQIIISTLMESNINKNG